MSRNQRKAADLKSAAPVVGADASEAPIPKAALDVGGGVMRGVLRGPYAVPELVYAPVPEVVSSPFGINYFSRRSRPIADDVPHFFIEDWVYDVIGSFTVGTTTTGIPVHHSLNDYILENWFPYYRRGLESAGKFRYSGPSGMTAMTDPTIFRWWLNLGHDVIADLVALLSVARLRQYNPGLVVITAYLTDAIISQAIGLWRRVSGVPFPSSLKAMAIQDGIPIGGPYDRCLTWRLWRFDINSLAAPTAYTALNTVPTQYFGGAAANVAELMTDLTLAVQVLEGACAGANLVDLTAMLDLITMGMNYGPTKDIFQYGLPAEYSWPVFRSEPEAWNDLFYRALLDYDTKGVSTDQCICFPSIGNVELGAQVPIQGLGGKGLSEFTLFGAVKAGILNSDVTSSIMNSGQGYILFGTATPFTYSDTSLSTTAPFKRKMYTYTTEDGGVALDLGAIDRGDGAAIFTLVNGGNYLMNHVYSPAMFAAQGTLELRFMDKSLSAYTMYVPIDDLCLFHATSLSQILGVPGTVG